MKRKAKEVIAIYLTCSVFLGLIALLTLYPMHPISVPGWIAWFLLALPVTWLGEAAGSAIFDQKVGKAIDDDTEHVSGFRIIYGAAAALLFLMIWIFLVAMLGEGGDGFLAKHFSKTW